MKVLAWLAVAGAILGTSAVSAAVVVDRSPDVGGFTTDYNAVNRIGGQNFFMQFTLASATVLTGMDIYSTFASFGTVNVGAAVVVRFRADVGGDPGTSNLARLSTSLSAIDTVGSSIPNLARLHADFTGVSLAAGTYWASLAGVDEIGQSLDFGIAAATRQFNGETQVNTGPFAPFRLNDDGVAAGVPEPASWALMVAGFGITGAALRRRWRVAA